MGMDPFTGAMILMAAGTGMQAMGSYQQGKAEKEAFGYQADLAKQDAAYAKQAASTEATLTRKAGQKVVGEQITSAGDAGLELSGSIADKIAMTARDIEEDAQMILYQGKVKAEGFKAQAKMFKWQGAQALKAGRIGAVTSLLLGTAQIAGMNAMRPQMTGDKLGLGKTGTPYKSLNSGVNSLMGW